MNYGQRIIRAVKRGALRKKNVPGVPQSMGIARSQHRGVVGIVELRASYLVLIDSGLSTKK